eukprot:1202304-Prymnesium_polylepis.1
MDFLLLPVSITLFVALTMHDAAIEPPGGWPVPSKMDALREPLNPYSTQGGSGVAATCKYSLYRD